MDEVHYKQNDTWYVFRVLVVCMGLTQVCPNYYLDGHSSQ